MSISVESLVARLSKLEKLIRRNGNVLGDESASLAHKYGLDSAKNLKAAFDAIEHSERLMQVGIVGRVKAGKSSLLNALFFGGQAVLPKAATPMTAALTTMTYGERLSAEVEFYSDADLRTLSEKAADYEARLEKAIAEAERELRQRQSIPARGAKRHEPLTPEQRERVLRTAQRELKENHELSAAYDQHRRIEQSGLRPADLGGQRVLAAEDLEALRRVLTDYVGAGGKYMPFTKSVHVKLPLDSLRDIQVIDTPGLNDPVPSREKRTNELLMHCDVVFIVSPAGQFLSSEDLQLMGRITEKEGVHELYLVASQVDNALYGSEIKKPNVADALTQVTASLGAHARSTLRKYRQDNPIVGETFDALIDDSQGRIINVSGMCHSLALKFNKQDDWDSPECKVWENLQRHYPNQFTAADPQLSVAGLELLANAKAVATALEGARRQKDAIVARKRQDLIDAKSKSVAQYQEDLQRYTNERINAIKHSNLNEIAAQEGELTRLKDELSIRMRQRFDSVRLELLRRLPQEMQKQLGRHYQAVNAAQDRAAGTEDYSYTVDKSGIGNLIARKIWGGGKETRYGTRTVVNTPQVRRAISKFVNQVGRDLSQTAEAIRDDWRKQLYKELFSEYRAVLGEEKVDPHLALRALDKVVNGIPIQRFAVDDSLPGELDAQGRLKERAADAYLDAASSFVGRLEERIDGQISAYVADVERRLSADIGKEFYADIDTRLNQLREDVQNSTESLDRLDRITRELKEVAA